MDRYTAIRLVLRACVTVMSIGPAWAQVQVGELTITPASDGVTVALAQPQTGTAPPGVLTVEPTVPTVQTVATAPRPAVTRITLSAGDLPAMQPRSRPLPPLPAPRTHEMERDVQTLKAARAALQLDDQSHERKLASR
jgi:hypothetical protein